MWTSLAVVGLVGTMAAGLPAARPTQLATKDSAPARSGSTPRATRIKTVSRVCMVTDRYFGKEQIPVEVEGRTYYGCCAMCKDRLAKDAAVRSAADPISGKTVDKSRAVIARTGDDSVLYFETEANLRRYNARR